MPEGPPSDQVVKVLLEHGFRFVQQRGSHAKYRKDGPPVLTVIVPMHKGNLKVGTFRSICRQAYLRPSDF